MSSVQEERVYTTETTAVRRTGLSVEIIQECVTRRLVAEPLTNRDLTTLRRVRRLRELGINMAGIEVILHMRHRLEILQGEAGLGERNWQWSVHAETNRVWERMLHLEPDQET
jgi:hypothetical protein